VWIFQYMVVSWSLDSLCCCCSDTHVQLLTEEGMELSRRVIDAATPLYVFLSLFAVCISQPDRILIM
jgi:hypothetical protein